jgi:hypothetical protein
MPAYRPRLNHVELANTVLKTSRATGEFGPVHVKLLASAKTGTELSFGNAPMAGGQLGSPASPLRFLTALPFVAPARLFLEDFFNLADLLLDFAREFFVLAFGR